MSRSLDDNFQPLLDAFHATAKEVDRARGLSGVDPFVTQAECVSALVRAVKQQATRITELETDLEEANRAIESFREDSKEDDDVIAELEGEIRFFEEAVVSRGGRVARLDDGDLAGINWGDYDLGPSPVIAGAGVQGGACGTVSAAVAAELASAQEKFNAELGPSPVLPPGGAYIQAAVRQRQMAGQAGTVGDIIGGCLATTAVDPANITRALDENGKPIRRFTDAQIAKMIVQLDQISDVFAYGPEHDEYRAERLCSDTASALGRVLARRMARAAA